MKVFVKRSALTGVADREQMLVVGAYENDADIDPLVHGSDVAMLSVPVDAIEHVNVNPGFPQFPVTIDVLKRNWLDGSVVEAETDRRIEEVFPEHLQTSSTTEMIGFILQYGADSTKWPAEAKKRKAEFDRCLNYMNSVRRMGASMKGAPPGDITADSRWPAKIARYKE